MAHLEAKRKEVAAMQEAANVAKEQALALLRLQRRAAELEELASGGGAPSAALPAEEGTLVPAGQEELQARHLPAPQSALSMEDRRRFGLDRASPEPGLAPAMAIPAVSGNVGVPVAPEQALVERRPPPVRGAAKTAAEAAAAQDVDNASQPRAPAPRWSSLSVEDRARFGLDGSAPTSQVVERSRGAGAADHAAGLPDQQQQPAFQYHPDVLWGGVGGSADAAESLASGTAVGSTSMSRTIAQLEAVGATRMVADLKDSERRLQSLKLRR